MEKYVNPIKVFPKGSWVYNSKGNACQLAYDLESGTNVYGFITFGNDKHMTIPVTSIGLKGSSVLTAVMEVSDVG